MINLVKIMGLITRRLENTFDLIITNWKTRCKHVVSH